MLRHWLLLILSTSFIHSTPHRVEVSCSYARLALPIVEEQLQAAKDMQLRLPQCYKWGNVFTASHFPLHFWITLYVIFLQSLHKYPPFPTSILPLSILIVADFLYSGLLVSLFPLPLSSPLWALSPLCCLSLSSLWLPFSSSLFLTLSLSLCISSSYHHLPHRNAGLEISTCFDVFPFVGRWRTWQKAWGCRKENFPCAERCSWRLFSLSCCIAIGMMLLFTIILSPPTSFLFLILHDSVFIYTFNIIFIAVSLPFIFLASSM